MCVLSILSSIGQFFYNKIFRTGICIEQNHRGTDFCRKKDQLM